MELLLYLKDEINKLTSKEIKGKYTDLLCHCFIAKIVEELDSISVLTESSCAEAIKNEVRVLFERCVSLKFIINNDESEKYARAYFLENYINKKKDYEKLTSDEYYNKRSYIPEELVDKEASRIELDKVKNYINKYFSDLYENWKENKSWYWNMGISNFRELCKKVNFAVDGDIYYEDLYGEYSLGIHAKDSLDLCIFEEDGISLKKLRHPKEIYQHIRFVFVWVNSICKNLYEVYLNGNKEALIQIRKVMPHNIERGKEIINNLSRIKEKS